MKYKLAILPIILAINAYGTAIYDYTIATSLTFSQPWTSVERVSDISRETTSGTGTFSASTGLFESSNRNTYTQAAHVQGSAGDLALTESGTSNSQAFIYNLFSFDFGSTPTDFSITLSAYSYSMPSFLDYPVNVRSEGTGDKLTSGSTGFQILLLTGSLPYHPWEEGQTVTASGLTGIHQVRFGTFAEGGISAVYPITVPDTGSTLAFLGMALAVLGFAVGKGKTEIEEMAGRLGRGEDLKRPSRELNEEEIEYFGKAYELARRKK